MNIDKMKAGIELDALAEKSIFGKCWPIDELLFKDDGDAWWCIDYRNVKDIKYAQQFINDRLPKRSTNITAAWEVVEKLRKDGFTISLHETKDGMWCVTFWRDANTPYDSPNDMESIPKAICLAGLKAIGLK